MRNFFQFILRFHALFLFIVLEIVSLVLLFRYNHYHRVGFLHAGNAMSGKLYSSVSATQDYFRLKRVNDSLALENAKLYAQLKQSFTDHYVTHDTVIDTLPAEIEQVYAYVPARVINNSTNKSRNFIYLDKGSKQGIKPESGVINHNGIVGIVVNVSENYSVAMSVLNRDAHISAMLKRTGHFGNLEWLGKSAGYANITEIPNHVQVAKGDTVVTSGYSAFFPEGILIGYVEDYELVEGTNFMQVNIKLSTDFHALSYVYVLDFLKKTELKTLQDSTESAEDNI